MEYSGSADEQIRIGHRQRIGQPGWARLTSAATRVHRAALGLWKAPRRSPPASQPRPEGLPPARVLVADDHPASRNVLLRILRDLGMRTDAAASGREAIDRLRLLDYDLVLMDRWMPGLDGVAATAAIRRREGAPRRTVVVAMSSEVSREEHDCLMECGTDDVLLKPVHGKALEAVLRKWLPQAVERKLARG
ncbi:MAG: response regulator [Acidobacteria bacterium]|nr:response regulator [Acidobacteriota bacterium]